MLPAGERRTVQFIPPAATRRTRENDTDAMDGGRLCGQMTVKR